MSPTSTVRAFIAMEINDAEVKKKIEEVQASFSKVEGKMKFVELENVHITLKFLGDISEETACDVYKVVQELGTMPAGGFDVAVRGLGMFEPRKPRVLWCGLDDPGNIIRTTYQALESELEAKLNIPREKKKFQNHVTLARIKFLKNPKAFLDLVAQHADMDFGRQHVDAIHLKKSVLTPRGPIYSDLHY
nr:RNA 2',3'-cyclic phosphodiesterase [Candidatus Sigynarchaeota archaeon]